MSSSLPSSSPAPSAAPSSATNQSSKLIFAPAGQSTGKAEQYTLSSLSASDLDPNPFTQFNNWFSAARSSGVHQPETVCLSTCHLPSGSVSSRFVYMKELDSKGFVVYSNFGTSRKGRDLVTNPKASLAFWWHEVERQVRVEGRTERLSREETAVYFDVRARGSQVGAWASPQSSVLPNGSREELDRRVEEVEKRFEGRNVETPEVEWWGGIRVIPEVVEFWQGRESRLHDRFQYTKQEDEEWKIERLSP